MKCQIFTCDTAISKKLSTLDDIGISSSLKNKKLLYTFSFNSLKNIPYGGLCKLNKQNDLRFMLNSA